MSLKTFAVVAAVAAGSFGFADRADAQWRRGTVYYPTYSSGYTYPSYSSSVYSSNYVIPASGVVIPSNGVITTSGYVTPYSTSSYYDPYNGSYYNGSYYNGSYYNGSYYNGYNSMYNGTNNIYGTSPYGLNVGTSGVYFGGRRIGRW